MKDTNATKHTKSSQEATWKNVERKLQLHCYQDETLLRPGSASLAQNAGVRGKRTSEDCRWQR